jgi:hypothetical protein
VLGSFKNLRLKVNTWRQGISSEVHGSDQLGSGKVDSIAPSPRDEQAILESICVSLVRRDKHR